MTLTGDDKRRHCSHQTHAILFNIQPKLYNREHSDVTSFVIINIFISNCNLITHFFSVTATDYVIKLRIFITCKRSLCHTVCGYENVFMTGQDVQFSVTVTRHIGKILYLSILLLSQRNPAAETPSDLLSSQGFINCLLANRPVFTEANLLWAQLAPVTD